MGKYYKLKLSCGKSKVIIDDDCNPYTSYGYIAVLPTLHPRDFYGTYPPVYEGLTYVIAEIVDNHFEEIIFGTIIGYDPNGLRYPSIFNSEDELYAELRKGLNCFEYEDISDEKVAEFYKIIRYNRKMKSKYKKELEYIKSKAVVKEELDRRRQEKVKKELNERETESILNDLQRKRKGNR